MDTRNIIIQLLYDKIEPLIEKAFDYPKTSFFILIIIIALSMIGFYNL